MWFSRREYCRFYLLAACLFKGLFGATFAAICTTSFVVDVITRHSIDLTLAAWRALLLLPVSPPHQLRLVLLPAGFLCWYLVLVFLHQDETRKQTLDAFLCFRRDAATWLSDACGWMAASRSGVTSAAILSVGVGPTACRILQKAGAEGVGLAALVALAVYTLSLLVVAEVVQQMLSIPTHRRRSRAYPVPKDGLFCVLGFWVHAATTMAFAAVATVIAWCAYGMPCHKHLQQLATAMAYYPPSALRVWMRVILQPWPLTALMGTALLLYGSLLFEPEPSCTKRLMTWLTNWTWSDAVRTIQAAILHRRVTGAISISMRHCCHPLLFLCMLFLCMCRCWRSLLPLAASLGYLVVDGSCALVGFGVMLLTGHIPCMMCFMVKALYSTLCVVADGVSFAYHQPLPVLLSHLLMFILRAGVTAGAYAVAMLAVFAAVCITLDTLLQAPTLVRAAVRCLCTSKPWTVCIVCGALIFAMPISALLMSSQSTPTAVVGWKAGWHLLLYWPWWAAQHVRAWYAHACQPVAVTAYHMLSIVHLIAVVLHAAAFVIAALLFYTHGVQHKALLARTSVHYSVVALLVGITSSPQFTCMGLIARVCTVVSAFADALDVVPGIEVLFPASSAVLDEVLVLYAIARSCQRVCCSVIVVAWMATVSVANMIAAYIFTTIEILLQTVLTWQPAARLLLLLCLVCMVPGAAGTHSSCVSALLPVPKPDWICLCRFAGSPPTHPPAATPRHTTHVAAATAAVATAAAASAVAVASLATVRHATTTSTVCPTHSGRWHQRVSLTHILHAGC